MQTWPNFGFTVAYVGSGGSLSLTPLAGAIGFTGYAPTVASGSSSVTASITTNRVSASNTGVAPFLVHFDATATTATGVSKPFHELYHSWNFGDNDTVTWDYGTLAGVAKKNRATGPIAAHVFETPGTYTVNYIAIDPLTGNTASTSTTITVQDPDTVFSGTNTICISTSGNFTGAPSGASQVTSSSWAAVVGYMTTGKRVLLRAGETWTTPSGSQSNNNTGPGILGSFGSGAKPKVIIGHIGDIALSGGTSFQDWRIMDLEIEATALGTDYGGTATKFLDYTNESSACRYNLALRVYGHHLGRIISPTNDGGIVDSRFINIQGGGGNVAIFSMGYYKVALLGSEFNDSTYAEHVVRLQGVQDAIVSHCTIKDPKVWDKSALTIRGFQAAGGEPATFTGTYTERVLVSHNDISGDSYALVQIDSQNDQRDERLRNIIFEGNKVAAKLGMVYDSLLLSSVESDFVVRNNLFNMTNFTNYACRIVTQLQPAPACSSAYFYNNTVYSQTPDGSATADSGVDTTADPMRFVALANYHSKPITGVVCKNNVAYLPSSAAAFTMIGSVSGTGNTYTESNNSNDTQVQSTNPGFGATPPVTNANWTCSGYPVNAGTAVPVYDDFFGAQRTGTMDTGAIQP